MQKKIMAAIVAFIMLATGVCVFIVADESSDATIGINTVNVYYQTTDQNNQFTWNCSPIEKINLYEALDAVLPTTYALTANSSWTTTSTSSGTYPSETYGTVTGVSYNNVDYTSTFSIKVRNEGDTTWTDVTNYPLGWIRPFTDYGNYVQMPQLGTGDSVGSAYANVAICLTSDVPSSVFLTTYPLKALTNPAGLSAFLYTFDLKDMTNSITFSTTMYGKQFVGGQYVLAEITDTVLKTTGTTIYGFGSDAYLALLDATGGTATGELLGQQVAWIDHNTHMTQYSWMDKLFGYGTQYGGDNDTWSYRYWASYQKMNGVDGYASFNLGYHTTVSGFYSYDFGQYGGVYYCTGNHFVLKYEES